MPPPLNTLTLGPRLHKSGRITGFVEMKDDPVNRNVEIAPGLPAHVPQLLHLNLWPGAITTPTSSNPLGLPDEVTQALAFLTRSPRRISGISPLVKTAFRIWTRPLSIPGLTEGQLNAFVGTLDGEVLNADVPVPSLAIATELRSRLLLTLTKSADPNYVIGALSGLRGVSLVEPVTALYHSPRESLFDDPPATVPEAKQVGEDYLYEWMHKMTYRTDPTVSAAWDTLVTDNIAILDSGALKSHPSLVGAAEPPDAKWFPRSMDDVYGHGTHIASQIVGRDLSQDAEFAGLIPTGVLPKAKALCFNIFFKTPNANNHFEINPQALHTALSAIRWWHTEISVINLSIWMKGEPSQTILDDFAALEGQGVVIVACAGNNDKPTPNTVLGKDSAYRVLYPARLPKILSVGAIDGMSVRAPFSRFSTGNTNRRDGNDFHLKDAGRWPLVDIVAPGVKVWGAGLDSNEIKSSKAALVPSVTTQSGYGAIRLRGTSMAAPYVTAGIAAVCATRSSVKAEAVRLLIRASVDSTHINLPANHGLANGKAFKEEFYGAGALDYTALIAKAPLFL